MRRALLRGNTAQDTIERRLRTLLASVERRMLEKGAGERCWNKGLQVLVQGATGRFKRKVMEACAREWSFQGKVLREGARGRKVLGEGARGRC